MTIQNIGGNYSIFTPNFKSSGDKSQLLVFVEPKNEILTVETVFDTYKVLKTARVSILFKEADLQLISEEKEDEFIVGLFNFKPEGIEICVIAFYFSAGSVDDHIKKME